jgi:predicted PurR-regulated permease PerM
MGESVGVSPMAVIFAIFAGGELFGVWGLVLAIPAAALIKLAWIIWIHPWIRGRPAFQDEPAS